MTGRETPRLTPTGPTRRAVLLGGGVGLGALLAGCAVGGGSDSSGATLTATTSSGPLKGDVRALFMKQAGYSEDDINSMIASFTAKNPGVKVTPEFVSYEALHDKIVAAAPAGTYDVVLIDVIWPAEFGTKRIVADVTALWPAQWKTEMLDGAVRTPEYDGKEYGVPWILDSKYFFYNTAHLQKAGVDVGALDTWDGVVAAARSIKKAGVVKYPLVWSWQQAEALICDYTQLLGAFGGKFFDSSNKPAFNNAEGVATLEFMRQTLQDGLSNPTSTQSLEEDVRKVFSAGQASMALNWTYMYGLANDPKQSQVGGKVKALQTPAGPKGRPGVNGSMALSITGSSKNQQAAWALISHLTSQEVQDKYAISSLPCWRSSFDDPAVIKTNPQVVPQAKKQLADMIVRPAVTQYNQVSQILQAEIQKALSGSKSSQKALDDAASQTASLVG